MNNVIFLVDKSGSMSHRVKDTIQGFNSFVDDLRTKNPDSTLSLYMFNSKCECSFSDVPIADVKDLTDKEYRPLGGTALFDAMGEILTKYKDGKFIILTDGYENDSEYFTQKAVKKLIANTNMIVTYIGADVEQSVSMGIIRSIHYDGNDTLQAFNSASQSI